MSTITKKILSALLLVTGLGVFGYYAYTDFTTIAPVPVSTSTSTNPIQGVIVTTDGSSLPSGVEIDENPTIKITQLPDMEIPDLDRPVAFSGSVFSSDMQKKIRATIADISARLKDTPGEFGDWMELGLQRNSIADYEGARLAWEYASALRPSNSISFGNLGFLYGYRLHDFVKAEKNYLTAIKNDSKMPYLYIQASEFYRDAMNNSVKAKSILQQGLKSNPNNSEIQAALNNLSK